MEQDENRPETLYDNPDRFLKGADGSYFVLDRGAATVLKYDSNGVYLGSFGGKGDGPGEFSFPQLEVIEGDTLIMYDQNQMRITRYRSDGTLLDVIPTQAFGWMPYIRPLPDGRVIVSTGRTENQGDFMYRGSLFLVLSSTGDDTLCALTTSLVQSAFVTYSGRGWSAASLPFAPQTATKYVPGRGILVSAGDRPELAWHDLAGEIRTVIRIGLEERVLTAEIKEEYRRALQQRRDELAALRGQPSRPIGEVHFPDRGGYWGEIIIDDAGYLWLRDVMSNPTWDQTRPWLHHVVSPEGRYLGTVDLPCRTGVISDGTLLAIVTDPDTGAEWAVVYRIAPAVEGLIYP
jgi:hypothetical protein